MSNEGEEQLTPIERPLLRSDLNEIRDIVQGISQRQLLQYKESQLVSERVTSLERRLWFPALVSIVAAALAVLARIVP
jgi:cobalamin biosynthesis protein CobD/CbiB